MSRSIGLELLDRMVSAVEKVTERLHRCAGALDAANVPYAVIGGNAVAAWVATVDEAAVRNTQDVDLLIRRTDLPAAQAALGPAGFVYRHVSGIDMFMDGPNTKARDAVHIVFAGEKVREEYDAPAPAVEEAERPGSFAVLGLPALLRMKLTSYRRKDQVHIQDFIGVGLVDESWLPTLSPTLAARLKTLLDDPEG